MQKVDCANVVDWLKRKGHLPAHETARAELLAWGVSNVVLRIEPDESAPFVVKQSRERLRTAIEWRSSLERIWRERSIMQILQSILPPGTVPHVLFSVEEDYAFAMQAVDRDHAVWKQRLLQGTVEIGMGRRLGDLLACIHTQTVDRDDVREQLTDTTVFEQLRVDPFYRHVARQDTPARAPLEHLCRSMPENARCLVLADFSPKNILLLEEGGIVLVDFETGHWGDPAFDLGFFLSHIALKGLRSRDIKFGELAVEFWKAYRSADQFAALADDVTALEARAVKHLAGCMLARVVGKSPVDYLNAQDQETARKLATQLLCSGDVTRIADALRATRVGASW